jgi:hypothetical protein
LVFGNLKKFHFQIFGNKKLNLHYVIFVAK